jgi:hypothetical protein
MKPLGPPIIIATHETPERAARYWFLVAMLAKLETARA